MTNMVAPNTQQNGQIVPRGNGGGQRKDLKSLLHAMGPEIAKALPRHIKADRMARIALTALSATPKLAECTPASFLGSIVQAAQLGLEVNTPLGQAYLIPYKQTCQLIIGYQGMMDLARRSGMIKAIYAFAVYQGDEFSWSLGLNPNVTHTPSTEPGRETKPLTHVYAVAKLEGGEPIFTVLTRSEIDRYRKRSKSSNDGPWVTDYEAMALKTAIRRLFRWLPKSAEMAQAVSVDEAPELGRSQLESAPEVIDALQAQGIDTAAELASRNEEFDPSTGELREDPPMGREPGVD